MTSKRLKIRNRWISITLFFLFSLVLFINNVTDIFLKLNIRVSVYYTAWIGLITTWIYTLWMASQDKI